MLIISLCKGANLVASLSGLLEARSGVLSFSYCLFVSSFLLILFPFIKEAGNKLLALILVTLLVF